MFYKSVEIIYIFTSADGTLASRDFIFADVDVIFTDRDFIFASANVTSLEREIIFASADAPSLQTYAPLTSASFTFTSAKVISAEGEIISLSANASSPDAQITQNDVFRLPTDTLAGLSEAGISKTYPNFILPVLGGAITEPDLR